ncbi:MAG TPA: DUF1343 domain-containing protein [Spirochaetes bacterium]|nr:DUF1343 domain-containing protein [Spirochaetota bacterium]
MVQTGLDFLLEEPGPLEKKRVALIVNQTSVTSGLDYGWRALARAGIEITRIFSPEHGLFSTEQDQVAVGPQPGAGIEVASLYGSAESTLAPGRDLVEDLDLVVFDIQDVGARYYTYLNTMAMFMETLNGTGIEFMVLDRPNPLGGLEVEGPPLEDNFRSFVGILPVPVRHGLTAGECALLYRAVRGLDLDLKVVPMKNWRRGMYFDATGLPWVPPSPNMPTVETALVYPGMCLLEGTGLSEGRGTTVPFLQGGAPWVEPEALAEALNREGLAGVIFRPVFFKPGFQKHRDRTVGGVYLHVTDRRAFRPFLAGVAFVKAVRDLWPEEFAFLRGVYEFNSAHPAFDLLTGGAGVREMIENGAPLSGISRSWEMYNREFREARLEYLLY